MTLPDERYRSLVWAYELLGELQQPGNRVPKYFKDKARMAMRHYPNAFNLKELELAAPNIIQERMDGLRKFLLKGKQHDES